MYDCFLSDWKDANANAVDSLEIIKLKQQWRKNSLSGKISFSYSFFLNILSRMNELQSGTAGATALSEAQTLTLRQSCVFVFSLFLSILLQRRATCTVLSNLFSLNILKNKSSKVQTLRFESKKSAYFCCYLYSILQ